MTNFMSSEERVMKENYLNEIMEYFKEKYEITVDKDCIRVLLNEHLHVYAFIDIRPLLLSSTKCARLYINATHSGMHESKDIYGNDNYLKELEETLDNLKLQANEYINFINYLTDDLIDKGNNYIFHRIDSMNYIKNIDTKKILTIHPLFNCEDIIYHSILSLDSVDMHGIRHNTSSYLDEISELIHFMLD